MFQAAVSASIPSNISNIDIFENLFHADAEIIVERHGDLHADCLALFVVHTLEIPIRKDCVHRIKLEMAVLIEIDFDGFSDGRDNPLFFDASGCIMTHLCAAVVLRRRW